MIPFDVVTGRDDMVSQGGSVKPWLTMSSQPVTTSNGIILIASLPESPTYSAKLKKLF